MEAPLLLDDNSPSCARPVFERAEVRKIAESPIPDQQSLQQSDPERIPRKTHLVDLRLLRTPADQGLSFLW